MVHIDIPRSVEIWAWVLRITSCSIIGENLIWRFFMIYQTAKLKSSPNFPAIRYYPMLHYLLTHSSSTDYIIVIADYNLHALSVQRFADRLRETGKEEVAEP